MVVSCGICSVTFCTGAGNGCGGRGSAEDCWIASSRTVLRTSVLLEPVTLLLCHLGVRLSNRDQLCSRRWRCRFCVTFGRCRQALLPSRPGQYMLRCVLHCGAIHRSYGSTGSAAAGDDFAFSVWSARGAFGGIGAVGDVLGATKCRLSSIPAALLCGRCHQRWLWSRRHRPVRQCRRVQRRACRSVRCCRRRPDGNLDHGCAQGLNLGSERTQSFALLGLGAACETSLRALVIFIERIVRAVRAPPSTLRSTARNSNAIASLVRLPTAVGRQCLGEQFPAPDALRKESREWSVDSCFTVKC